MNDLATKIKKLIEVNNKLRALVEDKLSAGDVAKSNRTLLSVHVFGKAYRTHYAIIMLCERGYGEDAFTLARTSFELMVNFTYIMKIDFDERFSRYTNHEIVARRKLLSYMKSSPHFAQQLQERLAMKKEGDFSETIDIENEYNRLIELYGDSYKKHWSGKGIDQMASEIGRKEAYETIYRLQCSHSHADILGISSNTSFDKGGFTIDLGSSGNWVIETLAVAFDYLFRILEEANTQLGWGLKDALKKIEQEYVETSRTVNCAS